MNASRSSFSIERLAERISQNPPGVRYRVGFSGGADSTALLVAMSELRSGLDFPLSALHFNHHLHEHSDQWQQHCKSQCQQLGVSLECHDLNISGLRRLGVEAEARKLRYERIAGLLETEDIFLTAHHLEDQAETLLLNLMRGSGIDGLAAMPARRPLGKGMLFRPLLEYPMASLRDYVLKKRIAWIEDPSNQDLNFDRNYVRHCVLPELEQRWPDAARLMARSAAHCRQASAALDAKASELLTADEPVIRISILSPGSTMFSVLFRHWLKSQQAASMPFRKMLEFERQLIDAAIDRQPCVAWDGFVVHAYRDHLWLQRNDQPPDCPRLDWLEPGLLVINAQSTGTLEFQNCPVLPPGPLTVGHVSDGDRIMSLPGGKHRLVKEVLRETGIPPWLRKAVPLLRRGKEVLAVGSFCTATELTQWLEQHSSRLDWKPVDPLLRQVVVNHEHRAG